MTTPEQRARKNIDDLLTACGWTVQSRDQVNLGAGRGVAVREFPLKTGFTLARVELQAALEQFSEIAEDVA